MQPLPKNMFNGVILILVKGLFIEGQRTVHQRAFDKKFEQFDREMAKAFIDRN